MKRAAKQLCISLTILFSIYLVLFFPNIKEKETQQDPDDHMSLVFHNMILNVLIYILLISGDVISCINSES